MNTFQAYIATTLNDDFVSTTPQALSELVKAVAGFLVEFSRSNLSDQKEKPDPQAFLSTIGELVYWSAVYCNIAGLSFQDVVLNTLGDDGRTELQKMYGIATRAKELQGVTNGAKSFGKNHNQQNHDILAKLAAV